MQVDRRVTLVMPIYNTLGRTDSAGFPLVNRMMLSITSQTVQPSQILILDNRSDDETVQHLADIAAPHLPVRIQIDSERRPPEEAISVLMQQADTPYVAVVNDDDAIGSTYIAELLRAIETSRSSLAYTNGRWLGLDGRLGGPLVMGRARQYGTFRSSAANFQRFLRTRNPVPVLFGLWRTPVAQRVFDVRRINEHSHDLDNMILATALGSGESVSFVNRHLFFYSVREGHREPPRDPRFWTAQATAPQLLAGNWSHHIRFAAELLTRIRPSQAGFGHHVDVARMAAIASIELRRRLDMSVTWALQLSPTSRPEFNQVRALRRIFISGIESRARVSRFHRAQCSSRSRGVLSREIEHWQRVETFCAHAPRESEFWGSGHCDIVEDVARLVKEMECVYQ